MRIVRMLVAVTMVAVAGPTVAATGEYWQVKQQVSMDGMAMPAMDNRVCIPTDAPDETLVPAGDDSCRTTGFQTRGNKTTYRFECTGEEPMSGQGEFERLGPDAYRGRTTMTSKDGEMIMEFEGRKVGGACDPEAPMKQFQAQMAQGLAEACLAQGESLAPPERNPQLPAELDPGCDRANKEAYCEGVKSRLGGVTDRQGFASVARVDGWRKAASFCGVDPDAMEKRHCGQAVADKDYGYVAQYCEADARRIGATCAGRDGTALSKAGQIELLPICVKYGPGDPVMIEQGAAGDAAPAEPAAPPAKESALDKLKKGTKGLKDLMKIPGT
jgi:hypothetical protein